MRPARRTLGRPAILLTTLLLLALPACGQDDADESGAPAEAQIDTGATEFEIAAIRVDLAEENGSGRSGFADLTATGESTDVVLELDGADAAHAAHVHLGTCDDRDPTPAFPLEDVQPDEEGGDSGSASSETTLAVALDRLLAGTHSIDVHESGEDDAASVACGEITGRPDEDADDNGGETGDDDGNGDDGGDDGRGDDGDGNGDDGEGEGDGGESEGDGGGTDADSGGESGGPADDPGGGRADSSS